MIVKSVVYLQGMKILELLIPIIAMPFVIRAYGMGGLGLVVLAQVVSQYLIMIGDWGFNATATKEFSAPKVKYLKWSVLFRDVQRVKILYLLALIPVLILLIFLSVVDAFVLLGFYLLVASSVLQIRWFFQARFKLAQLMCVSAIFRVVYLCFVLFWLSPDTPIVVYVLLLALPSFSLFVYSNIYFMINVVSRVRNTRYCASGCCFGHSSSIFKLMLKDGWYLVNSRVLSALVSPAFMYAGKVVYGLEFVGFMGVAQRIVSACITVSQPVIDVVFPVMANSLSKGRGVWVVYRTAFVVLGFSFLFCAMIFLGGGEILQLLEVPYSPYQFMYLSVVSILIPISLLNSLYAHALVAVGRTKYIVRSTVVGCLLGGLFFWVVHRFGVQEVSIAVSIVVLQSCMLVGLLYFFVSSGLKGRGGV